jgi:hypothetical protein
MNEQDLAILTILLERGAYMNTYWNFFIVVSSALIGVLASGKEFTNSMALKVVFALVFVLFAISNFNAIESLVNQRVALLKQLSPKFPIDIKCSVKPKSLSVYLMFHIALDVLVLASIFLVPWYMKQKNSENAQR